MICNKKNALAPIDVTVDGIYMLVNELHVLKLSDGIDVTESGIAIFYQILCFRK